MLPLDLTLENDSQPASQKLSKEPVWSRPRVALGIECCGGMRPMGDYGQGAFKNPIDWRATTCEANSFKLQRWLQTVIRYRIYSVYIASYQHHTRAHCVWHVYFYAFKDTYVYHERKEGNCFCANIMIRQHCIQTWINTLGCTVLASRHRSPSTDEKWNEKSNPVYFSISTETFDSHERICQVDHPQCASAYFPQTFP